MMKDSLPNRKSPIEGVENLIFLTPEMRSFKSKVGGLGDVGEELGKSLAALGIKTTFITPLYKHSYDYNADSGGVRKTIEIDYSGLSIKDTNKSVKVNVVGDNTKVKIKRSKIGHADVIFLENETYADIVYRGDLLKHAIFMGRGTLETLKKLEIKPTIIHYHDALTALVSFVRTDRRYSDDPFFDQLKLAYTIHNAGRGYQQIFDIERFDELGIDEMHRGGMIWENKLNLMYAGVFHSNICNTVSDDYAVTLKRDGEGMKELFIKKNIFGIINGIDFDFWKIKKTKKKAKAELIEFLDGYTDEPLDKDKMLIVMPRRIAFQKGLEVVLGIVGDIVRERSEDGIGAQFAMLGRAHEFDEQGKQWENDLKKLNKIYEGKFIFINAFDQKTAKLMYEGADLLFYPSKPDKEPCGTGYMLASANMTPTLGTSTGGLVESIEEFDPKTGKGNGFKVSKEEYSPQAFLSQLRKISDIYYNQKKEWKTLLKNCFERDFDFKRISLLYIDKMYKPLLGQG